jgi:hypothetical protein
VDYNQIALVNNTQVIGFLLGAILLFLFVKESHLVGWISKRVRRSAAPAGAGSAPKNTVPVDHVDHVEVIKKARAREAYAYIEALAGLYGVISFKRGELFGTLYPIPAATAPAATAPAATAPAATAPAGTTKTAEELRKELQDLEVKVAGLSAFVRSQYSEYLQ